MIVLVASQYFPYIAMGLAANFLLIMMMVPTVILPARRTAFTAEFMKQFEDEHDKLYPGLKPDPIGQPDQGSGWYA